MTRFSSLEVYNNLTSRKERLTMTQNVYADLLFLINFSMDYLCLFVCARILHRKMRLSRMILASAIGGAYSVAALFLTASGAVSLAVDCLVCLIMCAIVFSERGRRFSSVLLCAFLYVGISMMTGGCMTAIFNLLNKLDIPLGNVDADGISTYLFAILAAVAGFISTRSGQIISRKASAKECKLKIRFCNCDFEFLGLCDTGNLVRDPISSKPVIFLDRKRLSEHIDLSFLDEYANGRLDPSSPCKNLRLMVINTAAGKKMIVAAAPQSISVEVTDKNGKSSVIELDTLISPSDIGKSADDHNAIVPAEILKI